MRLLRWLRRRLRVLPSRAAYALWAARYPAEAHNPFMMLEQAAMLDLLPRVTGQRVLDAACGTGRYARLLMEQGAAVVGCDHSLDMLRLADGARCGGDLLRLPFGAATFDGIVCALAIGHTSALEAAVAELGRVLRPSGWLLVSDLHPYQTLRGAQRTFRAADGRHYAVEHHLHTMEATVQALNAAGLTLEAVREPQHAGWPTVLVWRARRLNAPAPAHSRP
ncbi:MAG: methyltransferase domain-containing protein [Aggregatilineales bacterium]